MKMSDLIAQIDVEIEACERAIRNSYSTMEVEKLTATVQDLIKKRFAACNLKEHKTDELSNIRNWDGYGYYKRSDGS
jgi:hypothetical protein